MKLEIKGLSKQYGNIHALRQIDCIFTPGIYGVLGANGAGKSTMIRLLMDTISRDGGSILWNDMEILKLGDQYRMDTGYMPQYQGFYPYFSARMFLIYMGRLKGLKKGDAEKKAVELLNVFHLEECKNKRIKDLSGGMRQRLMIAQALINNPKILILDEPTAGVDPEERIAIRNYISQIANDKIVIIATHIVSDVEAIAKEIIVMDKGEIVAKGSPEQLIRMVEPYVYQCHVTLDQVAKLENQYVITNLYQTRQGLVAKIINFSDPKINMKRAVPNLEDVYMYFCGKCDVQNKLLC